MSELFIYALLGHLVGDYIFQTKTMALTKSTEGKKGARVCTIHVLIYTASVCLLWGILDPVVWLMVGIPHWIIDRYSLASMWLKIIKGRTFESALATQEPLRQFDIAFTSLVYAVVDNTFHLLCLVIVIQYYLA